METIDALTSVFSSGRVGVKLSPIGRFNDMYDSDPKKLFKYLLKKLSEKKIAFVEMMGEGEFLTKPSRWGKGEE